MARIDDDATAGRGPHVRNAGHTASMSDEHTKRRAGGCVLANASPLRPLQVRGEPVALCLTQTSLRSLTRPSSPLTLGSQMPRVAVTLAYFDFFPELKAELATLYPTPSSAPIANRFRKMN